jgi:hypothetical protein
MNQILRKTLLRILKLKFSPYYFIDCIALLMRIYAKQILMQVSNRNLIKICKVTSEMKHTDT